MSSSNWFGFTKDGILVTPENVEYVLSTVTTDVTTADMNFSTVSSNTEFDPTLDAASFSERTIKALKDALGYGDVVVKCDHCGQWGAVKTACKHCGAAVG